MKATRWAALLSGLAVAAAANAQVDFSSSSAMIKALTDQNVFQGQTKRPASPGEGELGLEDHYVLLHGDMRGAGGSKVTFDHDVIFLFQGYKVTCDHAEGDQRTGIFTCNGNVYVDGVALAIHGEQVTIDFHHRTYEAYDATATIGPKWVQGNLTDNLYVKGRRSFGSEAEFTTLAGDLTTCKLPMPHYDIEADSIVVRPGRRVIFRKTKIKILGYTVLRIPYLSIPLDERSRKNTPEVGKSEDEGYYIKNRYDVPLKNPNYDIDTREDYMSLLGLGLGGQYNYRSTDSAGYVGLYHIFGQSDMLSFANSHRQAFSWGTLSIDNDYEKDNYLIAPGSTSLNSKIMLTLPQGQRGSDRITLTRSETDSFGYQTIGNTIGITDQRDFGSKLLTTTDVNFFQNESTFASSGSGSSTEDTERIDVNFKAQKDLDQAVASMQYQRSIPIGSTQTYIGGADATPVLALDSDSKRLFGPAANQSFPFKTELSWGEFQDPGGNGAISRLYYDFNFNKTSQSTGPFKLDYNGEFKQGIYSDGTAEYVLIGGTNLRYDFGGNTGINLRYNYMRPYGYSPLSIDETGASNYFSTDINVRPVKPLLLGLMTGFDLLRIQQHEIGWQQIGLRSEYQPAKWLLFRGQYTYDTFNQEWDTLQFDLTWAAGATKLTLGADYEGEQHEWSAVNLLLDALKIGRLKFSTALAYNGYLQSFDTEQFNFTYDMTDCTEAIFQLEQNNTGFRPGQTMSFYIRIKALGNATPLGIGTRGQPIGITNGTSY